MGAVPESLMSLEMKEIVKSHTPERISTTATTDTRRDSFGRQIPDHRSLLDLAKDASTTSAQFLTAARAHPEELVITEDSGKTSHGHNMNSARGFHSHSSFVSSLEGVVTGMYGGIAAGRDTCHGGPCK